MGCILSCTQARKIKREKAATEEPGKFFWTVGCKNVHAGRTKKHYFKKKGRTRTAEPEIPGVSRGRSPGQTEAGGHCH